MPTPAGFMGPYNSPKDPAENVGTLPAAFLGAVNWLKQGTNIFPPGYSSCGANITIEMHMKDCEDKPRDITPPTALCQRFTRLCLPLSPTPLFIPLLSFEAGQHNSLHQTTGGMMTRVSGPYNPTATLVFYVLFHVALVLGQSAGSIPPQSPPHRFAQPDQTSEALRVTAPNWLSPLLCVYHQQQHWPPTVALGGEQDRGGEGGGGVRSRWRGLGRFGWLLYRSLSSRTAPKPLATQWGSWTRVASLTHAALHPALATTVGPFARLPRVETSIGGGLLLTCVRLRG